MTMEPTRLGVLVGLVLAALLAPAPGRASDACDEYALSLPATPPTRTRVTVAHDDGAFPSQTFVWDPNLPTPLVRPVVVCGATEAVISLSADPSFVVSGVTRYNVAWVSDSLPAPALELKVRSQRSLGVNFGGVDVGSIRLRARDGGVAQITALPETLALLNGQSIDSVGGAGDGGRFFGSGVDEMISDFVVAATQVAISRIERAAADRLGNELRDRLGCQTDAPELFPNTCDVLRSIRLTQLESVATSLATALRRDAATLAFERLGVPQQLGPPLVAIALANDRSALTAATNDLLVTAFQGAHGDMSAALRVAIWCATNTECSVSSLADPRLVRQAATAFGASASLPSTSVAAAAALVDAASTGDTRAAVVAVAALVAEAWPGWHTSVVTALATMARATTDGERLSAVLDAVTVLLPSGRATALASARPQLDALLLELVSGGVSANDLPRLVVTWMLPLPAGSAYATGAGKLLECVQTHKLACFADPTSREELARELFAALRDTDAIRLRAWDAGDVESLLASAARTGSVDWSAFSGVLLTLFTDAGLSPAAVSACVDVLRTGSVSTEQLITAVAALALDHPTLSLEPDLSALLHRAPSASASELAILAAPVVLRLVDAIGVPSAPSALAHAPDLLKLLGPDWLEAIPGLCDVLGGSDRCSRAIGPLVAALGPAIEAARQPANTADERQMRRDGIASALERVYEMQVDRNHRGGDWLTSLALTLNAGGAYVAQPEALVAGLGASLGVSVDSPALWRAKSGTYSVWWLFNLGLLDTSAIAVSALRGADGPTTNAAADEDAEGSGEATVQEALANDVDWRDLFLPAARTGVAFGSRRFPTAVTVGVGGVRSQAGGSERVRPAFLFGLTVEVPIVGLN